MCVRLLLPCLLVLGAGVQMGCSAEAEAASPEFGESVSRWVGSRQPVAGESVGRLVGWCDLGSWWPGGLVGVRTSGRVRLSREGA